MKFYFAPMEGITGYIYRNAHHTFFNGIDKYFSPFIAANQSKGFKTREINDILPENNKGYILVPQILTNNAEDFIHTSNKIKTLGYDEINLNLGCPSGTVVSKNKGSGFLSQKEELDRFLDAIFSASVTKISIKTRIGRDQPDEFYELVEIFNKYPLKELIIHPRIQKDYYRNQPNMEMFKHGLTTSNNPVCYNGDIFTVENYKTFTSEFPNVDAIMLGRGLLTNPAMISMIQSSIKLDKQTLKDFHDTIYEDYKRVLSGERNVLFKMKELWFYFIHLFSDNDKYAKKIRKAQTLVDYNIATASLFKEQTILEDRL